MKGNGSFGEWIIDSEGLPAYDYKCNQFHDPIAKSATTYGYSIDHFHQIGNDRILATAHNGGYIQLLESSRGFQWLTLSDSKKGKLGGGIALFQLEDSNVIYNDLFDIKNSEKNLISKRVFGMGYFQKMMVIDKISIEHNICAPFSDDPVLISEIKLINQSDKIRRVKVVDFWDIYLYHILKSLVVTHKNRKLFGKNKMLNLIGRILKNLQKITKTDTDGARNKFNKRFSFSGIIDKHKKEIVLTPEYKKSPSVLISKSAKHNYFPDSLFISMIHGEPMTFYLEKAQLVKKQEFNIQWENVEKVRNIKNPCLGIGSQIELKKGESQTIVTIFGYSSKENIDSLIEKYKKITSEQSILSWNAKHWQISNVRLECKKDPWLARETMWHSYYTRSACYFDKYSNLHKFPQGSIYLFGHGLDGAIRDYMFFLYSIIFINPKLAKEHLSYSISLMSPNGMLPYSVYGFGKIYNKMVHSRPSDLYLFLLWGIIEYLFITRDFEFLNQKIPFYPRSLDKGSTVLERISLAISYLLSEMVGFGEHGLIKCNDGDWSDGISLMVKNRKSFKKYGESNFNSTFALYLIPKILPLLEKYNLPLAKTCKEKLNGLMSSVNKTWNGKWFYRGYDGKSNPIGDKNLYLEHHTWLLISEMLDKEKALTLISEIHQKLDKPSPIGQYISYPPQKTKYNILPKGWDVNGGIWHAINSLLTWAYSKYDIEKAYNSLIKNSLQRRASIYPNVWYGIWSGPDSYISDYAENAGQAFYHILTPMRDFPLMNLNLHTCFLLSVIKMVGFEANYNSISIDPKMGNQPFSFSSSLFSINSEVNQLSIDYNPLNNKKYTLEISKPNWWNEDSKILLNNQDVRSYNEIVQIEKNKILIIINKNVKKVNILLK